jgi:hypothetical protein
MKIAMRFLTFFILLTSVSPAMAMGSGNKYVDLQTGVTYRILQPTNTLTLPVLNFEVRPCRLHPGKDEYLLAGFGGMDRGIALVETAAAFNCTGIDNPQKLGTVMINGITATIGIYCATGKCAASQFVSHGGEISFTLPATQRLKATYIRLGTQGGFSQSQLIAFARGLKPVAK